MQLICRLGAGGPHAHPPVGAMREQRRSHLRPACIVHADEQHLGNVAHTTSLVPFSLTDKRHIQYSASKSPPCSPTDRCAYAGVAECSVYVAEDARRRGVGRRLLERLISSADAAGIWTIQTGI